MPHQTPLEHARRVTRGVPELETVFLDLHRVLYVLVYGGFPITETHAEVAARSCRKIRRALG
jgi:hypothetical protein